MQTANIRKIVGPVALTPLWAAVAVLLGILSTVAVYYLWTQDQEVLFLLACAAAASAMLFFFNAMRRPSHWLVLMALSLFMVPTSSNILDVRKGEVATFSLFTRYIVGVVSVWDILLAALLVLLILSRRIGALARPLARANKLLFCFVFVWAGALFIGFLHSSIIPYGLTTYRNVVQQALPILYLCLSYLLAVGAIRDERDVDLLVRVLYLLAIASLVQGGLLLALASRDIYPAMPGFLGIPIVLYEQLNVLTLAVYLVFAKLAFRTRVTALEWTILAGGVFFLLLSTRRLTVVSLVVSVALIWLSAGERLGIGARWIRFVIFGFGTVAAITVAACLLIPEFRAALDIVIRSVDITSDIGSEAGGQMRMAQIQSLFLNMDSEAPASYVWGMGLGTQWYEYMPMGLSGTEGSTAFSGAILDTGNQGWWPYFHLAYLGSVYRFGAVGAIFLGIIACTWFVGWRRNLTRLPSGYRPIGLMVVVVAVQILLCLGDSLNSSLPALFGIWLGALEVLARRSTPLVRSESRRLERIHQEVAGALSTE